MYVGLSQNFSVFILMSLILRCVALIKNYTKSAKKSPFCFLAPLCPLWLHVDCILTEQRSKARYLILEYVEPEHLGPVGAPAEAGRLLQQLASVYSRQRARIILLRQE